jgi:hypothetical protein
MEQSPSWEADQFSQLTKNFPAFYGTRRFFTLLKSARNLYLSWANFIQSPRPPPTSTETILKLSSHQRLGLPNGLFPSGFPTNTLCTPTTFNQPTAKSARNWHQKLLKAASVVPPEDGRLTPETCRGLRYNKVFVLDEVCRENRNTHFVFSDIFPKIVMFMR